jgi:membrane associated rhomboid family serine protease
MSAMERALSFRRPGPVTSGALAVVVGLWLLFGVGINWLRSQLVEAIFQAFVGSVPELATGQLWRLVTAPFVHAFSGPYGVWDLVFAVLGLVLFAAPLEREWGSARFARTSAWIIVLSYALQAAVALVLPRALANAVLDHGTFYGTDPWISALFVAWACGYWDRELLWFGVLPMTGRAMVVVPIVLSVLRVVALAGPPQCGLLAPFFAMGLGALLGGSTPSPLRKAWLRYRLGRLERAAATERSKQRQRAGLRVIEGGRRDDDDLLH